MLNGKSCGDHDQVIRMINQSLDLDNNCAVSSTACSYVLPYKTATVCTNKVTFSSVNFFYPQLQVTVTIGSIDFSRQTFDICNNVTLPELMKVNLIALGVPTTCPVTKSSVFCYKGDKQFKLTKASQRVLKMFAVTKKAKVRFNFKHDTGTSCFESNAEIQTILDE